MTEKESGFLQPIEKLLQQDYRGVNIAVYAIATTGLAVAIHKIRPVSKFSKASKIPDHFIENHQPLKGIFTGLQQSPTRVLIDHKAPIYLPLWHSSKPPLPVKLWGVNIVSGHAASWLDCIAKGKEVTLKPIARDKDDLVSSVLLHTKSKSKKTQTLDIGQTLVELGYAKASVPKEIKKSTIESQLAPAILSAEARARKCRNGIWSEELPPPPIYLIYWRKGLVSAKGTLFIIGKKIFELLGFVSKNVFIGTKSLILRTIRTKQVSTT